MLLHERERLADAVRRSLRVKARHRRRFSAPARSVRRTRSRRPGLGSCPFAHWAAVPLARWPNGSVRNPPDACRHSEGRLIYDHRLIIAAVDHIRSCYASDPTSTYSGETFTVQGGGSCTR